MIPKIIHRCWLGPNPMPDVYKSYGTMWWQSNPDWEVIDWSWHNLSTDFIAQDTIDLITARASKPSIEWATQLADIIGYELTYKYGGIYMNADIKPIKPLSTMFINHPKCENMAFAALEQGDFLVNAVTGGPARSSFWKEVLDGINHNYINYPPQTEMVFTTGPRYLDSIWRQDINKLYALPIHTFNPIWWGDLETGSTPDGIYNESSFPEDTIGMHCWGHKLTGRSNVVP